MNQPNKNQSQTLTTRRMPFQILVDTDCFFESEREQSQLERSQEQFKGTKVIQTTQSGDTF